MDFGVKEAMPTPYVVAKQQWDERIGAARVQAFSWRIAAFVAMAITLISVVGLIHQSTKASVIPYIVEIDEIGKVRLVGTPVTQEWEPSDGVKRYFLEEWIRNVRGLSSDRTVVRQNWLAAYGAVTVKGKAQLDEFAREYEPFARVGREETRQVDIRSVNRVSEESWRVEWVEKTYVKGMHKDTIAWVGVFRVQRSMPTDIKEVETNPLGLYVAHLSWSRQANLEKESTL